MILPTSPEVLDHITTIGKFYGFGDPVVIGTESVYKGLFDMYSNEMAAVVGAPKGCDDETLRDYMGQFTLEYLSIVEADMSDSLKGKRLSGVEMASLCFNNARDFRPLYLQICFEDKRRELLD